MPISGFTGDNLLERPEAGSKAAEWYKGRSLIEVLDALPSPGRVHNKPCRVYISDCFKATTGETIGECVAARVESGVVREKDELVLVPHGQLVTVKSLESRGERCK